MMCRNLLDRSLRSACNLGEKEKEQKIKGKDEKFYNLKTNVAGLEIILVAIYLPVQIELHFDSNSKSSVCSLQGRIALRSHEEAN